jgi:hypothetical protein
MVFVACEKSEQPVQQSNSTPQTTEVINYVPATVVNHTGKYFEAIDTVCRTYLQYATKINISGLEDFRIYESISDGILNIDLNLGLAKFGPAVKEEWNGEWNVRPYVEANNPPILQTVDSSPRRLRLSKKCYVFGFEVGGLSGAYTKRFDFTTTYVSTNSSTGNVELGSIRQYIKQKNGARLFAVKSDTPFDEVIISFDNTGDYETKPENFAITNIRYITDKQIYDAHKDD